MDINTIESIFDWVVSKDFIIFCVSGIVIMYIAFVFITAVIDKEFGKKPKMFTKESLLTVLLGIIMLTVSIALCQTLLKLLWSIDITNESVVTESDLSSIFPVFFITIILPMLLFKDKKENWKNIRIKGEV